MCAPDDEKAVLPESCGQGGSECQKWRCRRHCCHSIVAGTTAVVPARFVSHLRVANRLRRLCPLGTHSPTVPAGVIGRREGARIRWMQLPKAASDWQPSTETRIWHGSAKDDD